MRKQYFIYKTDKTKLSLQLNATQQTLSHLSLKYGLIVWEDSLLVLVTEVKLCTEMILTKVI